VSRSIATLLELLDLEVIDTTLYRGRTPETSLQRVFGGQVAGQALVAAGRTVEADRQVHSLHAYFLRPGDPTVPIVYEVDLTRDGRSFTTRRVVAIQHGRPIFNLSASFQLRESGLEHQDPMPATVPPEELPTLAQYLAETGDEAAAVLMEEWGSIDVRHVVAPPEARDGRAHAQAWLRAAAGIPDDPLLHVCVLAYASDLTLLSSTLVPHRREIRGAVQMASLDHAMWFHRPFRADEWLLYDQVSPSASGGRGLATGRIFTRDGVLVASVVQEGLIRPVA
jgi:acyl-CoA thioesterase II